MTADAGSARVLLYWIPLGAGGHLVGWNGRLFEALTARHEHRPACDLYHSALEVHLGDDHVTIEMAPVCNSRAADRGVVTEGPVGTRWLGRSRLFRYEIRRWSGGAIPDLNEAAGPQRLSHDPEHARLLLTLVPSVPALTWGHDEQHTGEMWNSNSLTAWLLARRGHETTTFGPPTGGRAPGWHAGLILAAGDPHPTSERRTTTARKERRS